MTHARARRMPVPAEEGTARVRQAGCFACTDRRPLATADHRAAAAAAHHAGGPLPEVRPTVSERYGALVVRVVFSVGTNVAARTGTDNQQIEWRFRQRVLFPLCDRSHL